MLFSRSFGNGQFRAKRFHAKSPGEGISPSGKYRLKTGLNPRLTIGNALVASHDSILLP
jgi:hypothetical protein